MKNKAKSNKKSNKSQYLKEMAEFVGQVIEDNAVYRRGHPMEWSEYTGVSSDEKIWDLYKMNITAKSIENAIVKSKAFKQSIKKVIRHSALELEAYIDNTYDEIWTEKEYVAQKQKLEMEKSLFKDSLNKEQKKKLKQLYKIDLG